MSGTEVGELIGAVELNAVASSVALAREFVRHELADDPRCDTAELLVSEACTNSVRHSRSRDGGSFTLALHDRHGVLHCEIVDDGAATLPTRREGDEPRDNGYGIVLIEAMADRFGYTADPSGSLHTWFELSL
ncbi:ATP-binding protein [Actinomadura rupiterrae]|uniref:ATP-binding protein n=1 Tax=Actinomadura rupiterrae TaxID=559627 RepID=UPI0020A4627D|nr:ATP-binding protein [Actinomadura rupiterrae]MCP2343466.1 anti-sigma regulatory factor (Ser/Thr protein kinase) [Actinomadura rupiterrae]